jgi:hypothetical protein
MGTQLFCRENVLTIRRISFKTEYLRLLHENTVSFSLGALSRVFNGLLWFIIVPLVLKSQLDAVALCMPSEAGFAGNADGNERRLAVCGELCDVTTH